MYYTSKIEPVTFYVIFAETKCKKIHLFKHIFWLHWFPRRCFSAHTSAFALIPVVGPGEALLRVGDVEHMAARSPAPQHVSPAQPAE